MFLLNLLKHFSINHKASNSNPLAKRSSHVSQWKSLTGNWCEPVLTFYDIALLNLLIVFPVALETIASWDFMEGKILIARRKIETLRCLAKCWSLKKCVKRFLGWVSVTLHNCKVTYSEHVSKGDQENKQQQLFISSCCSSALNKVMCRKYWMTQHPIISPKIEHEVIKFKTLYLIILIVYTWEEEKRNRKKNSVMNIKLSF